MSPSSTPSPAHDKTPGKGKGKAHGKGGGKSKRPGPPEGVIDGKLKRGRPSSLTPQVHKDILYNVQELLMLETEASAAAGLDPSMVSGWKARGLEAVKKWDTLTPAQRAVEAKFRHFFEALRDARPNYIRDNLDQLNKAAKKGNVTAIIRRLEYADRARFGQRLMVGNDPKHPLPTTPVLGAVMILPDNGRLKRPAASPTPAKDPAPDDGSAGGRPDGGDAKGV